MMEVKSFTFNDYQENTYVLISGDKCIIIDPGNYSEEENFLIKSFINERSLKPQYILITHAHIDHVLGIDFLSKEYLIDVYIPSSEKDIYNNIPSYAPIFGMSNYKHNEKVILVEHSNDIFFDEIKISTLFLPGHSPGHLGYFFEKENICFSGDVLFKNSIGRTDLPGGDFDILISSIKNTLFRLDDDVIIYPGHGPSTTIIDEINENPFLN